MSTAQQGIQVRVAPDRARAIATIAADVDPNRLTSAFIAEHASEQGVLLTESVRQRLEDLVDRYRAAPDTMEVTIAESKAPVGGRDGYLEWHDGFDATACANADAAGGSVDHYSSVNYVMVKRSDHVVTIHEPTVGEDGIDVIGNALAATPGRPLDIVIDKDTLQVDESGRVVAKIDGILDADNDRLTVSAVLVVSEYVDFSTGNIDFEGSVHIRRGVRDRFVVEATENVVVDGLIEAATIAAGRDFVSRQGMAAKDRGDLTVGGDADAGYLNNVRGAVQGNLVVHREIVNCDLTVGGDLECEKGAIVGGETTVAGSLRIGTVGSAGLVPTTLVLGVPRTRNSQLTKVDALIRSATTELEGMRTRLAAASRNTKSLTHEEKERLTELAFEIAEAEQEVETLDVDRQTIVRELQESLHVDAVVNIRLHAEVRLKIGDALMRFDQDVEGPLSIRTSADDRLLLETPDGVAHPLTKFVRAIDRAA